RYVDTGPNGEALRKCILSSPYKLSTVLVHAIEATDNSPAVAEHTTLKTPTNMSPENKAHFLAEKEAIHLILTRIGDDIYSTEDERVKEALTDLKLDEYTIKVSPPLVQKAKPPSQRNYVVHQMDTRYPNIPYPSRMHKEKQQEKDEVQIHKFREMFKKLHINITLADALILILKYQKMLKALLSNKEKLLELANTPLNENCSAVILKKLPEKFKDPGKFLILCGFSDGVQGPSRSRCLHQLDATLGLEKVRPFLQTARALIDVHGEEMILRDGDERLTLNMRPETSSYSNQLQKESINMINIYDDSCEDYLKDLFATNHQIGESSPNPTFLNPKRRNRRRSKQPFILEESPVDTMADQRTMAELLRTPIEGYAEAIVVPPILAEHFELKHSLINMMTSDQFFGLEKDNPHDHIPSVKAVEEICVTCGGAHPYYQCVAADGNTFLEFQDNIQGYILAAAVNYNQGNSGYRPSSVANQIRPSGFAQPNVQNNQNRFSQPKGYNRGNNFNQYSSYQALIHQNQVVPLRPLPSNTIANPKGKLTAITTRSGLILDGPSVPMPPSFINSEEDEHVEDTSTDSKLGEFTIKVPPPFIQKAKPASQRNYVKMVKALLFNKALADLGASINLMPLSVWKTLGLPELISTRMTLELANRAICTPAGIARDVFVPIEKFTFPANFVIVDYESDPRVPLILGRPFLRTTRSLIDVYGEEMILHDGDERLTLNMRHDTSSYSNQPQKEPINMINIYDDSCEDYLEDSFATNHLSGNPTFSSHTDLTSPEVINPLSGSITSSSDHLLKEFADELALITFPPGNDDLLFDIEFHLREIEYLLNHDPTKEMDYILEDSVDEGNLIDPNENLVHTISEMFTDEHTLDYSSPPIYDDFEDDLFELESYNDDAYNDPFDFKEEKIKESKLLIDELDPLRSSDFLPLLEYDSFLFEDFFKNLFDVTTRVAPDKNEKKLAISHASLILEDFDPPLYELPFYKEVPASETLISFSSKNEEKVFKPRILTSK
nr:hypothetical protein [Tanacetum cinerariifolium]